MVAEFMLLLIGQCEHGTFPFTDHATAATIDKRNRAGRYSRVGSQAQTRRFRRAHGRRRLERTVNPIIEGDLSGIFCLFFAVYGLRALMLTAWSSR